MKIETEQITIDESRRVTFREAEPSDEPLLMTIYRSTRLEELALTGWSQEQREEFIRMQFNAQQLHYSKYYPQGRHLIILLNDEPVGRLYVAETEEDLHILDITILPQYRSAGIGTPIIKLLMRRASDINTPLHIYVESYNRSRSLFERLGFVQVGESGINYFFEWRA
jgi:RimJ/RimL family protein N-acetyltransferase